MGIDAFECTPFRTRLTVAACAARYTRANTKLVGSARLNGKLSDGGACIGCEIGRAHARGETPERWPNWDGAPVVRLRLSSAAPTVAPTVAVRETPGLLVPAHQVERNANAREREAKRAAKRAERAAAEKKPHAQREAARRFEHEGLSLSIADWSVRPELGGITAEALRKRLKRGDTIADVIAGRRPNRGTPGRPPKVYVVGERALTLRQWADEPDVVALGLDYKLLHNRIYVKKWPADKAMTSPLRVVSAPMGNDFMTRSFELPKTLIAEAKARASRDRVSVSELMREALRAYLESRAEAAE